LPIAITQSPTRACANPELHEREGLGTGDLQHREVGLGILADQLGGIFGAVGHRDGDRSTSPWPSAVMTWLLVTM
jgi:hypothetical protein